MTASEAMAWAQAALSDPRASLRGFLARGWDLRTAVMALALATVVTALAGGALNVILWALGVLSSPPSTVIAVAAFGFGEHLLWAVMVMGLGAAIGRQVAPARAIAMVAWATFAQILPVLAISLGLSMVPSAALVWMLLLVGVVIYVTASGVQELLDLEGFWRAVGLCLIALLILGFVASSVAQMFGVTLAMGTL